MSRISGSSEVAPPAYPTLAHDRIGIGNRAIQPPPLKDFFDLLYSNSSFYSETGLLRISLAGYFLGFLLCFGFLLTLTQPFGLPWSIGAFVSIWSIFHYAEFLLTALFHPETLTFNSYLLNHSREFHLALLGSMIEFIVELILFPALKHSFLSSLLSLAALLVCLFCQFIRSASMWQASTNFTHIVAHHQAADHRLVTHGLYSIVRHPAYAAWFVWSISTQILIINPICTIGYAIVAWRFFQQRINYEESRLRVFFGKEYEEYQRRVPNTGIPFVHTHHD